MSRTDWLLGFALLIVMIGVAFFGIFFWQQSRLDLTVAPGLNVDNNASPRISAVAGRTAIVGFGAAQNAALSWQADATLVSAKATWSPNLTVEALSTGVESWNFTFYSPSAKSATNVLVTQSNVAIGDPYEVTNRFQPMLVSGWKVNSDEAIQIFLDNGGEEIFLNERDVLLTTQLSTITDSGRMEWFVAAISDQSGRGLSIIIDATSGDILNVLRDS